MKHPSSCPPPRRSRSGATLTEVLMAIFVMSIGVVSVITLFPLAILRAVQATQLTNSKVLDDNIEEFINANTWVLRGSPVDPKLDPTDTTIDVPTYINSACVIDPLGEQFVSAFPTKFGNRGGAAMPTWALRRISPFQLFTPKPSYLAAASNTKWTPVERGWADSTVCSLQDSWVTLADDLPTDITNTTVVFPSTTDMGTSSGPVRLTLISQDNTRSLTRVGTAAGTTFTAATTEPNIPTSFRVESVGRAVVETNESRYTWIITCPLPAAAPPAASCAVFFRRAFDADEEFLHDNGGSAPFTANQTEVKIQWDSTKPTPLLREGNYIFDGEFCFWYRIRSYTVLETGGTSTATIELDQPARAAGRGAILPHGLVHVFDLELRGQK